MGKYKPYPAYKDSGVEWLGQMPSEWRTKRVGHLFCRKKDTGHPDAELLSVYRDYGVIPKCSREDNWNRPSEDLSPYQLVMVGDLVMNKMKTWQGSIAISDCEGIVSPAYFVAEPCRSTYTDDAQPRFIHYLLRSPLYIAQYNSLSKGIRVNQWDLDYDIFKTILSLLPPREEQAQIAAFLDHETAKIDRLIEKQEKLIELLKEKRQAVISHAVTKGLDPNVPMKDSGVEWLGEIPAHWSYTKFGRLAFFQEGPGLRHWQFTEVGVKVICVTNITDNGIDLDKLKKFISDDEYLETYSHFTVQKGDLLVSSSGNSWGKVAEYTGEEICILNTSTIRVNEGSLRQLTRQYIRHFLESSCCREQLGLAMTGACQPNFGPSHLNCVLAPIPPFDEQTAIIDYIESKNDSIKTAIEITQRSITLLQERRTSLISAAVTGKIDVREWKTEQAA